ncbi:hypothetical protein J4448_01125 [Candidatus Woesearchaeota archaeon]|nr:hypothetical protein [Candidatus Woesearchaeota archaeon]
MNEKNKELAEFLGILLGDGNLNKSSNCITIVGSLEEDSYYKDNVIPLIKGLFQVNPKLRNRNDRNAIYIDFNSKEVMDYLTNPIGLVRGNKVNAHVPTLIKNDISLIPPFLRGLFDTDGCFKFSKQTSQKNYYPRIQFCFSDVPFAREVKGLLEKLGFNFGMWKDPRFNGLIVYQISGSDNLEKWMKIIGSSNPVQKTKYQIWKKYGFYIPKSSLKSRIDSLNLNMEV